MMMSKKTVPVRRDTQERLSEPVDPTDHEVSPAEQAARALAVVPYMQNRELSWLRFDERVLDQGCDTSVPLLERLQFVSIFKSNLQEFFMVRVGSLTDMALLKKEPIDPKSNMTPTQQLESIYARCRELYPQADQAFLALREELADQGVQQLAYRELTDEQLEFLHAHLRNNVLPFLSPQIINARHPFPHLENGELYIIVRLLEEAQKKKSKQTEDERRAAKEAKKKAKSLGAEGVMLGIIPMPKQVSRVIHLPGKGFQFILLEDALEARVSEVYSMYTVKHTNIICVTRNADLESSEVSDESESDYREYMKKILKKRARLAPVRLESRHKLSSTVEAFLVERLGLKPHQLFTSVAPLDLSYAFALPSMVGEQLRSALTSPPFAPSWPGAFSRKKRIIDQVAKRDVLLSYPYESMDPFVLMLQEAASDPEVVSIKITLYRLASQSQLAEALIRAAEAGKEVTALFELRARFDESNNIQWSQRFEEAGAKVIYGFHEYKVHSKICCITRKTDKGLGYITQLGTGNYNEKTARLYTDFSFITADEVIGRDAVQFFRNMGLESASREYETLWVAPLQIKENILAGIDEQIELARKGKPCGLFFKTNSITDQEIIAKLAEASQAGVHVDLLVRGICCIVPQVEGVTDNVRVVSIVGRLLEHSRIYGFGPYETMKVYLSSADLMTRNMDRRVEIAWPVTGKRERRQVMSYIDTCLRDTAKLRELLPDGRYTPLHAFAVTANGRRKKPFNAQERLIAEAAKKSARAHEKELKSLSGDERKRTREAERRRLEQSARSAHTHNEEMYREALKHDLSVDDAALNHFMRAAMIAFTQLQQQGVDLSDEHALAQGILSRITGDQ